MFQRYRFVGWVGLVVLIVLVVPSLVLAAQLHITGVHVDEIANKITIMGQDLTLGPGPLAVTLGQEDITSLCQTPAPTATTIVCTFSIVRGLPADGDYRLMVARGNGPS